MIQQDAKTEMLQLGKKWEKMKRKEKDANDCLARFVLDYMKEHDYGKTSEELLEIIQYLPRGCYFNFTMWENFHELKNKEEAAAESSKVIDGVCPAEAGEKPSVLEQLRVGLPPREEHSPRKRGRASIDRD